MILQMMTMTKMKEIDVGCWQEVEEAASIKEEKATGFGSMTAMMTRRTMKRQLQSPKSRAH